MKSSPVRSTVLAGVVDTVLVIVFVVIGRASHREDLLGTLNTLWPFFVGLVIGWLISRAWRSPGRVRWVGIVLWVSTVLVGMLLRVASHQGIQLSFVIVATVVLAVFLLGWRGLAGAVSRRRAA